MRWTPTFFRWHRWLGWLVAIQVFAWIVGGLVFAWVPFQDWVKSASVVKKPVQPLPANWNAALNALPTDKGELLALQSVSTATGPAFKLRFVKGEFLISADGAASLPPSAAQVGAFAQSIYTGTGPIVSLQQLDKVPSRLGIVRELGEKRDVWQVRFDDMLGTRLYIDTASGEFLTARNEAWVLYDFLWRLHVMDYQGGEDFNNTLLRVASIAALLLTLTGLVLSALALRRSWVRKRRQRWGKLE